MIYVDSQSCIIIQFKTVEYHRLYNCSDHVIIHSQCAALLALSKVIQQFLCSVPSVPCTTTGPLARMYEVGAGVVIKSELSHGLSNGSDKIRGNPTTKCTILHKCAYFFIFVLHNCNLVFFICLELSPRSQTSR